MATNEATKKVDVAPRGAGAPRQTAAIPSRPPARRVSPFEFLQQVRDEGRKVTWPTRKETMITTAMVFVMVVVASAFFTIVDIALRWVVGLILGMGA